MTRLKVEVKDSQVEESWPSKTWGLTQLEIKDSKLDWDSRSKTRGHICLLILEYFHITKNKTKQKPNSSDKTGTMNQSLFWFKTTFEWKGISQSWVIKKNKWTVGVFQVNDLLSVSTYTQEWGGRLLALVYKYHSDKQEPELYCQTTFQGFWKASKTFKVRTKGLLDNSTKNHEHFVTRELRILL